VACRAFWKRDWKFRLALPLSEGEMGEAQRGSPFPPVGGCKRQIAMGEGYSEECETPSGFRFPQLSHNRATFARDVNIQFMGDERTYKTPVCQYEQKIYTPNLPHIFSRCPFS